MQHRKRRHVCFFVRSHRVGRKDLFVLPPHGLPGGKRPGHIQQPLVGAAAEAQSDVMLSLHEPAVHEDVQQGQQFIGDFAPGGAGLCAGQLLPGVAGVAPDRFMGVEGLEVPHKGQKLPLVLRLHGFAAQQAQPGDIVRLAGGEDFVADGLVEGLAVAEIPGYRIEAAGAVMAAPGNEDAGAHTGAVGDIVIFDGSIVHDG